MMNVIYTRHHFLFLIVIRARKNEKLLKWFMEIFMRLNQRKWTCISKLCHKMKVNIIFTYGFQLLESLKVGLESLYLTNLRSNNWCQKYDLIFDLKNRKVHVEFREKSRNEEIILKFKEIIQLLEDWENNSRSFKESSSSSKRLLERLKDQHQMFHLKELS